MDVHFEDVDFFADGEMAADLGNHSGSEAIGWVEFAVLISGGSYGGGCRGNAEDAAFLDHEDSAWLDDGPAAGVHADFGEFVLGFELIDETGRRVLGLRGEGSERSNGEKYGDGECGAELVEHDFPSLKKIVSFVEQRGG